MDRPGMIRTKLDSKRDNNVILFYYDAQTFSTFEEIVKIIIKTIVSYPICVTQLRSDNAKICTWEVMLSTANGVRALASASLIKHNTTLAQVELFLGNPVIAIIIHSTPAEDLRTALFKACPAGTKIQLSKSMLISVNSYLIRTDS